MFNTDGSPDGQEFATEIRLGGAQTLADVAALPGGKFVTVFSSSDAEVRAVLHDGQGDQSGILIHGAASTSFFISTPNVIPFGTDGFVVGFRSLDSNGDPQIRIKRYDADGDGFGDPITIASNDAFNANLVGPRLVPLADGGFMAIYVDSEFDADAITELFVQPFDASGTPVGAPRLIFAAPTGTGDFPRGVDVTLLSDGNVLVSFSHLTSPGEAGEGVVAQILTPEGIPIGERFRINQNIPGEQVSAVTVVQSDGSVLAVWEDTSRDTRAIEARVLPFLANPTVTGISFDDGADPADGLTNDNTLVINGTFVADQAVEILINGIAIGTTTTDSNGIWTFDHTLLELADGQYQITARQVDHAGNGGPVSDPFAVTVDTARPGDLGQQGDQILVNSQITLGDQTAPDATTLSNGNVVVVFFSTEGSTTTYHAPIFAPSGAKIGGEFEVSPSSLNGFGVDPKVVALEGGGFVVLTGEGKDARLSTNNITAQIFGADGTPAGAEFFVEGSPAGNSVRLDPDVAALPGGGFIADWEDDVTGNIFASTFDASGAKKTDDGQTGRF